MDLLSLIIVGALAAALWQRNTTLERRITFLARELESVQQTLHRQAEAAAEPVRSDPETPAPPARAEPVVPARPKMPAAREATAGAPEPSQTPDPTFPVAPPPTVIPGQEPTKQKPWRRPVFDFEDIFGRRLPIWGGGFALANAGIFLVRFSIEAGLLTPMVRVALSFVFGLALLAGAEAAFRFDARLADPRVRQALAGAGLATLYGAFYLAGTAYGLIGAGAAFAGLAAVTAAAIGLSFRFGLPSAVMGLVGGFAAPLLVDSDSANVPLLSFYLALITGGLAWSGQVQGTRWLSYGALAAGLGWGTLMMMAGVSSGSDLAALGLYLVVLGTVLPAFLHARGGPRLVHLAAGALATLQMAVLVSDAGFAPLTWGLYLLIGAGLAAMGWRWESLRLGGLVAAGLGLWLLVIWPEPDARLFALVATALPAIFAGVPLALHIRGRAGLLDLAQLGAVSLGMGLAVYGRFGSWDTDGFAPLLAAVMAALAVLPGAGFVMLWRRQGERDTRSALALLAPAALLAFAALLLISAAWLAPVMAVLVSAPLLWLHAERDARALQAVAWAGAVMGLLALMVTPAFSAEFTQLGDAARPVDGLRALLRWVAAAAPFVGLALVNRTAAARHPAEIIAAALVYGALAQILPDAVLAWIAAGVAIALLAVQPGRVAAWGTALAIAAAWSVVPLGLWLRAGLVALGGEPFMVTSAIGMRDLAVRVAPLLAALAVLWQRGPDHPRALKPGALLAIGLLSGAVLHSLAKQIFAMSSVAQFEQAGMAERSLWQAALVGAAWIAAARLPAGLRRPVGTGLIAAALAHFGWFTLVLHNPLLSVQNAGPIPIANWLTLAYGTAIVGLWQARRLWTDIVPSARAALDAAITVLVALGALSLMRQTFAGAFIAAQPIGQTESLLISLMGIVLALGYLWFGSRRALRSWRIGSLVLMLVAVCKVFLFDAAALEGLLRIASFMALGFSLIGIGWIYSRQLSRASLSPDARAAAGLAATPDGT